MSNHFEGMQAFTGGLSKTSIPYLDLSVSCEEEFNRSEACKEAFDKLKSILTSAPIMQPPDWTLSIEIMCDASNYAVRAVLG